MPIHYNAQSTTNPVFVTVKKLSEMIDVPEWTIRKHIREGKFPAYQIDGKQYLLKVEEVTSIISEHRV